MTLFTSLLHSLKQKIDEEHAYKEVVIRVITASVHVMMHADSIISLKNGVLLLQVHPTVKSAILLKKDHIVTTLQKEGLSVFVIR